MTQWLAACGLVSVMALSGVAIRADGVRSVSPAYRESESRQEETTPRVLRFIAVGDVNLGRKVGQNILKGDTLYPFLAVRDTFASYDVVFANLESPLSDQKGETQSPKNNLVFTGPPDGSSSLKSAGVTVVSTANNHALDYGLRGLRQTLENLDASGVRHAGTATDSSGRYRPVLMERNGIRIAILACTDVMNIEDPMWKSYVAVADTAELLPVIRSLRDSIDFIVVSYHGGEEYSEYPTIRTRRFARQVIAGGADLFLGHHPHVPYGIEKYGERYIVYSLGNFVFWQPDRFWTRRSFAFAADLTKDRSGTRVTTFRCLPVRPGLQPEFINERNEIDVVLERIRNLSSQSLSVR